VVWAVLFLLGVPLWLCAVGILALVLRNRALRHRAGDLPVRVRRLGHSRWRRAHALWVSDVFVWRASPAAWSEDVRRVTDMRRSEPSGKEAKQLRRLGDGMVLVTLTQEDGGSLEVATDRAHAGLLTGGRTLSAAGHDVG
jgi:hypothetical protein